MGIKKILTRGAIMVVVDICVSATTLAGLYIGTSHFIKKTTDVIVDRKISMLVDSGYIAKVDTLRDSKCISFLSPSGLQHIDVDVVEECNDRENYLALGTLAKGSKSLRVCQIHHQYGLNVGGKNYVKR